MESIINDNILYVDTESIRDTGEPKSVQWHYNGAHGYYTSFDSSAYAHLRRFWWSADAIVMFNAPYDLFTLARAFDDRSSYEWRTQAGNGAWDLAIFGHRYKIRGISGHRNLIKPMIRPEREDGTTRPRGVKGQRSTPVLDLLKLWSILVDDGRGGSISLKSLIRRELGVEAIEYSGDEGLTDDYLYQDVDRLHDLWHVFLRHVATIDDVRGYNYYDWGDVKTPATFVKKAYEREFPDLASYRKSNDAEDAAHGLEKPLESAYHGGITIAFRRGWTPKSAWYDINSAYANIIRHLNTDRWLVYRWEHVAQGDADLSSHDIPYLVRLRSTAVLTSINHSLKIFTLDHPAEQWLWSFDVLALRLIWPDATYEILDVWQPIPMLPVDESLSKRWIMHKEDEERTHGKTTLREYYKFMSNTSYGIKAQRKPFKTPHTNMVIAGLITARAHLILLEMVDEAQKHGLRWEYSDTDSICVSYSDTLPDDLLSALNRRIYPFTCECEGYDYETYILSLKRYISLNGTLDGVSKPLEKVKLHGKWLYDVSQRDIKQYVLNGGAPSRILPIRGLTASTPTTLKILSGKCPWRTPFIRPFDFSTGIGTEITVKEWFYKWFGHIDTKTWAEERESAYDEFTRPFLHFEHMYDALVFYRAKMTPSDEYGADDLISGYDGRGEVYKDLFPSTFSS